MVGWWCLATSSVSNQREIPVANSHSLYQRYLITFIILICSRTALFKQDENAAGDGDGFWSTDLAIAASSNFLPSLFSNRISIASSNGPSINFAIKHRQECGSFFSPFLPLLYFETRDLKRNGKTNIILNKMWIKAGITEVTTLALYIGLRHAFCDNLFDSGEIRTRASEETGA